MNKVIFLLALMGWLGVAHAADSCEAKVVNAPVADVTPLHEKAGSQFMVAIVVQGGVYTVKSHERPTGETFRS